MGLKRTLNGTFLKAQDDSCRASLPVGATHRITTFVLPHTLATEDRRRVTPNHSYESVYEGCSYEGEFVLKNKRNNLYVP